MYGKGFSQKGVFEFFRMDVSLAQVPDTGTGEGKILVQPA